MIDYTPQEEARITNNYNAYNKGFEAGKVHSQPSPLTLQFMENITNQITELKDDLKENLKDIPRMVDMDLFVTKAIKSALDVCDNRYAEKSVEAEVKNLDCKYASKDIEKSIRNIFNILLTATLGGAIALAYKLIEYLITFK